MDKALLAQRVREGDSAAFEEVFREYHTRIYNYAYRLVGNAKEANDLTQESFLKAYQALLRGEEPLNLSASVDPIFVTPSGARSLPMQGGDSSLRSE